MTTPGQRRRLNVDELLRPVVERRLRRLPRLLAEAFVLSWRAAPRELTISTVLQVIGGVGLAAQLLVGRELVSELLADSSVTLSTVLPELVALAVVGSVVSFANLARREQQRLLGELVGRYSADQVLEVAGAVELIVFDHPEFADRLHRAQVNALTRPVQVANGLLGVMGSLLSMAGIAAALAVLQSLYLTLVLLAYVPAWLASSRGVRLLHDFAVLQTERDRRRSYLFGLLSRRSEAAEIRSNGLERFLRRQHNDLYDERITELRVVVGRRLRLGLVGQLLTSLLTTGAIGALVWLVTTGRASVSAGAAAATAVVLLGARLSSLASAAGSLYEASLFLEDFTDFVELIPAAALAPVPEPATPSRFTTLTVDRVSFTYPSRGQPSLQDVSLEINTGEVVALVGANGSGKTTLAKLLVGLYVPDAGSIRWDEVDVATCDPDQLRSSVAVIFQDFARYHLTARDNVALGRHERSDDLAGIETAVRTTGAHDLISALPNGYDTRLGPEFLGGTDLSTGQWQRVALARSIFRDVPFVILDEPTAALDARAERNLFDAIRRLFADRAVLLISHRFASVRTADRIYVLGDGRVLDQGTHDELMARGGLYAELFLEQAEGLSAGPP